MDISSGHDHILFDVLRMASAGTAMHMATTTSASTNGVPNFILRTIKQAMVESERGKENRKIRAKAMSCGQTLK